MRYRRGAASVLAVLLTIPLVAVAMAAWHVAEDAARRADSARNTGLVWGLWMQAAHRLTQVTDLEARLTASPNGFALTTGEVTAAGAPPGLPIPAGMRFGVIPDPDGVPMAFAVLDPPDAGAHPMLRLGALDSGLADIAEVGGPPTLMEVHVPAMEAVLGSTLPAATLYVSADAGIAYEEAALYRRPQPGRPWLNRMEADIVMDSLDVTDVGHAEATAVSARTAATLAGSGDVGEDVSIATSVTGSGILDTLTVSAASMGLTGDLSAVQVRLNGDLSARTVTATRLQAASLAARGAVAAGQTVTTGELRPGSVSAGSLAAARVTVGGTLAANRATPTTLHIGDLETGSTGTVSAGSISTGPVFGPRAVFNGAISTGSCNGC